MELPLATEQRAKVEEFRRKHRTALLTLLFTDLVGSTELKQQLGDQRAVTLIQNHHALIRELLGMFPEAEEIDVAGDSFFVVFLRPSDAVRFALILHSRLRALPSQNARRLQDRVGIHIGEVVVEEHDDPLKPKDLYGIQVDTCARVMSLAEGNQTLLTHAAFDNARPVLKGEDLDGIGALCWLNHGPYLLKGLDEPIEICEVGEAAGGLLKPPPDSQKVRRYITPGDEPVLGWRPALGQPIPNTNWILEQKLGEGSFGEVWLGRHQTLKEQRVFKFCFRSDRVRSLKREVTIFRLLRERLGQHPNIVGIQEVFFDTPPFYIVMDFVPCDNLAGWCERQGGIDKVPLAARLEIVAQAACALQVAHDAGVIHRDIKPSNLLVSTDCTSGAVQVKLTDFGIGNVVANEALSQVTRSGFTQTLGPLNQAGTYMYMSPELFAGKVASRHSDLYSLAVVLYQLLVGSFSQPVTLDWERRINDPLLKEDLRKCFAPVESAFARAQDLAANLRTLEARRALVRGAERKAKQIRRAKQSTLAAAVLAIVVLALWGVSHSLDAVRRKTEAANYLTNMKSVAGIIADNSSAALAFDNQRDAAAVLSAVKNDSRIAAACTFNAHGKLYARYPANASDNSFPDKPANTAESADGTVEIFEPITVNEQRVGTIYLRCRPAHTALTGQKPTNPLPAKSAPREYQVKAAFIYNILQFTDWPPDKQSTQTNALTIGFLGGNPFGNAIIDTIRGESIRGKPVALKEVSELSDYQTCDLIFIAAAGKPFLPQILESLKDKPILTVGDTPGYANKGVMINMVTTSNKVRLQVNAAAITGARLEVSSKLLRAAQAVD